MLCIGLGFPGYMGWKMMFAVFSFERYFQLPFEQKPAPPEISICDCLSRLIIRHLRALWHPTVTFPSSSLDILDRNNGARRVNSKR